LLTITFIPFPTAVLAGFINTPQANIAVAFYSAALLVTNVGFNIWWLSMFRPLRLISASVSKTAVKRATIQIFSGWLIYASTTVISYWFPITGLMIIFGSQALWIVMSVGVDEKVM
jgi:hypothetical protein